MGKINIDLHNVIPGMITAEPVLSNDKQIILQSDTEITSHLINLLCKWGINYLCIRQVNKKYKRNDDRNTYLFYNEQNEEGAKFLTKYRKISSKSNSLFEYLRNNDYLPYDVFYDLAYDDLYQLISEKNILSYLYKVKPPLDYTYLHAINVGIIAGLVGRWSGCEEETVKMLILAGLMHDIGKVKIPQTILESINPLSGHERSLIELHPVYGYHMVKNINNIAPEIQCAILQHHERDNGCGYPRGLYSNGIHYFAKIVAVADVYDAMTSNRIYKDSVTPFDALEVLVNDMFTQFSGEYCKVFIRHAISVLTNSTVLLSDKTQAEVLHFDCFMSTKPVVKKIDGTLLDLNRTDTVSIVEVVKFA